MGKTTLVLESIKDRDDAVYYQATRGSAEQQISSFASDAAAVYPGVTRIREEWESLFGYLAEEDAVVVVDEFPYLVEQTEALPSILQRVWDHTASDTATTFVLTGSAIGMMYEYGTCLAPADFVSISYEPINGGDMLRRQGSVAPPQGWSPLLGDHPGSSADTTLGWDR